MRIAFVIPCLNEESAIAEVVRECRRAIPEARVYVFDNNSSDATALRAREAGAEVVHSARPGKGQAIRHAFRIIEADWYVMLDGDGTYPARESRRLVDLAIANDCEMVTGARLELAPATAFRPLHFFGNHAFTWLVRALFGRVVVDLLSGFRVFSRKFVNEVPIDSDGFELETELTIRALVDRRTIEEHPVAYGERTTGGTSKLKTFRDGFRILMTIARLFYRCRVRGGRSHSGQKNERSRDQSRAS